MRVKIQWSLMMDITKLHSTIEPSPKLLLEIYHHVQYLKNHNV